MRLRTKTFTILGITMIGAAGLAMPAQATIGQCQTSTVCVYKDAQWLNTSQVISGFTSYADLNGYLHDQASSWINANNSTAEVIGEYRSGQPYYAETLSAGWTDNNLSDIGFNDMADFVTWA
jgi:hypothetical protein